MQSNTTSHKLSNTVLRYSLYQREKYLLIFLLIFGPEPPDLVYVAAVVSRFKEGKPSVEGETDALSVKLWALSDNLGKFQTFGHNRVITSTVARSSVR